MSQLSGFITARVYLANKSPYLEVMSGNNLTNKIDT